MASAELAPVDPGEDTEIGLDARQIAALEKLAELGAEPAPIDANGDSDYDKDPKIRAYQLIYEGKWGGPNRGQGRKRTNRAAEELTQEIRSGVFLKRMKRALRRALKEEAGPRVNLDAIRLSMDIERQERKLQLDEEEADLVGDTREELLGTLFELVRSPATAAALEGTAEEITDAEVVEDNQDDIDREGKEGEVKFTGFPERSREKRKLKLKTKPPRSNRRHRDPSGAEENGRNGRVPRENGSRGDQGDRPTRPRADEEA